jgi:hypothetical protein
MKNGLKYLAGSFLIILVFSCDKVEFPYQQQATIYLDTNLYPGLWQNYLDNEYPQFTTNTNTLRNALLEEYTGHLCNSCPLAAAVALDIHESNPNRIFVAKIHVDPGALMSFQAFNPNGSSFYTNHSNPDAIAYGKEFENGFNFTGNPSGNVNREEVDGKVFDFSGTWQSRVGSILSDGDLKVNIQSEFNYFSATNGGFLHVEFEKLTADEIPMKAVVYVIQDSLVDWQLMPNNTPNEFYKHRFKHLGSLDGNAFGVNLFSADAVIGDKVVLDYSYALPADIDKENLHLLIYAYNASPNTYEVLQVIRQRIN